MIVRNVQYSDLEEALAAVNALFNDNIVWRRSPEFMANSRGGGGSYRLTLTVDDSSGPGGRRTASGRRIAAACWHAYGCFFDCLPESAVIVSNGVKSRAGDRWVDSIIYSAGGSFLHSDACECASALATDGASITCGWQVSVALGRQGVGNED